jgi:hypothetical protein
MGLAHEITQARHHLGAGVVALDGAQLAHGNIDVA